MKCPVCAYPHDHFRCLGCGMHNAVSNVPCISCSYFRFEPVSVEAPAEKPVPPPAAAKNNTKRRPRGVDSTQRN